MKSVLVTGASGFIGRQTLKPLVESGYDVHAIHHRRPPVEIEGVTWHSADLLTDDIDLETSHLLHLAWYAEPKSFWQSPENRRWLERSRRLLKRFAGDRAVVAGSCAEYDWSVGLCVENATRLSPRGLYGVCKDQLRRDLEELPLSTAWARIFFLFGPYEPPGKVVAGTICALLKGEQVHVSAAERRDFLYVVDAGAALAALVDAVAEGPINIGSGVAVPVSALAERVASLLGRRELLRLDDEVRNAPLVVADVRRLRWEVGFEPVSRSLADGLDQTVTWFQQQ